MNHIKNPLNVLRELPDASGAEQFEKLWERSGKKVERIVSSSQVSPPGFWYDQKHHEWVLVLEGSATMQIKTAEGSMETIDLEPGNYVLLAAGVKHRIVYTAPLTIWLAIHFTD